MGLNTEPDHIDFLKRYVRSSEFCLGITVMLFGIFFIFFLHYLISNLSPIGLDSSVVKSLPSFVYTSQSSSNDEEQPPLRECVVCLSEFEENETCRLLPNCNHSFHIKCIDIWFRSHSTCPLCRSPVELATDTEKKSDEVVGLGLDSGEPECNEPGPGQNRSPMSIMLSFKRILSREKRENVAESSSGNIRVDFEIARDRNH